MTFNELVAIALNWYRVPAFWTAMAAAIVAIAYVVLGAIEAIHNRKDKEHLRNESGDSFEFESALPLLIILAGIVWPISWCIAFVALCLIGRFIVKRIIAIQRRKKLQTA